MKAHDFSLTQAPVALDRPLFRRLGRVTRVSDLGVEAVGPRVGLGEICELRSGTGDHVQAEVVAIHENRVVLMPYGPCKGLQVGAEVRALERQPTVPVGRACWGT